MRYNLYTNYTARENARYLLGLGLGVIIGSGFEMYWTIFGLGLVAISIVIIRRGERKKSGAKG